MESSGTYTLHELVAPSKLLLEPPFTVGGVVGKIFIHLVVELKRRKLFEYTLITEEGSMRLDNLVQSVNDLCATDLTETGMISSRRYRHSSKQEFGIVVIEVKNCNSLNLVIVVLFLNVVPTVLLYSVGTTFRGNVIIVKFNEFVYFTSVTTTVGSAFRDCSNLEEITFPPRFSKAAGTYVFTTDKISVFDFPSTMTSFADTFFYKHTKAFVFICRAVTPPTFSYYTFNGNTPTSIYVPDDSVSAYKAANNWKSFASKIHPLSEYTG